MWNRKWKDENHTSGALTSAMRNEAAGTMREFQHINTAGVMRQFGCGGGTDSDNKWMRLECGTEYQLPKDIPVDQIKEKDLRHVLSPGTCPNGISPKQCKKCVVCLETRRYKTPAPVRFAIKHLHEW
jgi:hypothetical protein